MNTTSRGFGDLVANLGTPLYPQFGPLPESEPAAAAAPTTATTATAEPDPTPSGSAWLTWLILAALAMGGWYYFYPEQVHAVYRKVKGYIA